MDEEKKEIRYPKVIDYACGAGHFLTEGFREINEKIGELGLKAEKGWERDCIFGIEKDYRLARVSKISMFMHGADNGNIVFGDGLDNHNEKIVIENGQFDILVANPPYSVSAFKNHLELKNNELKLLDYISKDGKEIETLFVERIAQLLKPKGIAAVILPSSILSNSSTSYIKAREEILKNFAVHAIVQFGSKTFGATGTNTVVLYLQKNNEPPVKSEIVKDNVTAIFENEDLKVVSDKEIFDSYCNKISVSKEDYLAFIKTARYNEDYKQHKTHFYFGMYVKEFEASADFKKLKAEKLNKAFYDYALNIEKEKLYYFALVYKQKTLVVTAPSDNAEQENFLGYSWSNRKGDEGIKIKSSSPQNSCGLLYNVDDEEHSIAHYVKDAFLGIYRNDKYISANALKDMIDFNRVSFDKAIKTSVQSGAVQIESKFSLKNISELFDCSAGGDKPKEFSEIETDIFKIPVYANGIENDGLVGFTKNAKIFDECITIAGRGTLGFSVIRKNPFVPIVRLIVAIPKSKNINLYFAKLMFDLLDYSNTGGVIPQLTVPNFINNKIPLPPLDVQKSIVAECEAVDSEYQNAQKEIEDNKAEIAEIMANVQGEERRLSELCSVINPSKSDIRDISDDTIVSFVDMPSVSNDGFIEKKLDKPLAELRKGSYTYFAENDIIIAKITPCMENGKCAIARNLTNKIGMGSSEFHVFRIKSDYSTEFVFDYLNRAEIRNEAQKNMTGASGHRRVPISFYEALTIPVPPLAEQQKIVAQISALEEKITAAKRVMAECPEKKQAVLDKFLK
ncbi:N-6 DNA methylase [bacterium]|nr:N-6 DNA methylase [bacterium]